MHGLRRIQTETIKAKLLCPVTDIADDEIPRSVGEFTVEIESVAPVGFVTRAEICRAEFRQIIAVGSEVVVNHVENDVEPACMRGIDKAFQGLRCPINMVRRPQIDAVIAPIEVAGTFADR
jgi:hypothetical protein